MAVLLGLSGLTTAFSGLRAISRRNSGSKNVADVVDQPKEIGVSETRGEVIRALQNQRDEVQQLYEQGKISLESATQALNEIDGPLSELSGEALIEALQKRSDELKQDDPEGGGSPRV